MEEISYIVANNLKQIREKHGLSLEKTSELTGVSKTMLCQIEKADSSPSINTLYKIANALKISISALISTPQTGVVVVNKNDIMPVSDEGNNMHLFPLFPFSGDRKFEILYGEIEPGGEVCSEAHLSGTEEYLTVFQGELRIKVDNQEYVVSKQHAIHFRADVPHVYINQGENKVIFCNTIYYK